MRLAASVVDVLLLVYILLLLARLILEYIPMFNREWRPRGFGLVLAELVFTVTDPPLRLGPVAQDLGFPVTMIACFVLLSVVRIFERL